MKLTELTIEYVDKMPDTKEFGILYICKPYDLAIHLCACGCGQQSVTSLKDNAWTLTENDGKVTLRPSIGNFRGEKEYHAHYFITDNKIQWV